MPLTLAAGSGDFKSDGTVAMTGPLTTNVGTFTSAVANGASAVAFDYNTPAYSTAGALIARFKNNGVTKATINKDGAIGAISTVSTTGVGGAVNAYHWSLYGPPDGSGTHYSFGLGANQVRLNLGTGGATDKLTVGGGNAYASYVEGVALYASGKITGKNLALTGNTALGIVAKTANYTVTANDGVIECDATTGAITLTLPAVATATAGTTYTLKKTDASANAVIWDGNAAETIDGATTVQTTTQYASITIIRNAAGTAWLTLKD